MVDQRYYVSPVDYEAWRKGYMPPSEHILIDALHRGETKVVSNMRFVGEFGWWITIEDPGVCIPANRAKIMRELLEMDMKSLLERFDKIAARQPVEPCTGTALEQPKADDSNVNETGA